METTFWFDVSTLFSHHQEWLCYKCKRLYIYNIIYMYYIYVFDISNRKPLYSSLDALVPWLIPVFCRRMMASASLNGECFFEQWIWPVLRPVYDVRVVKKEGCHVKLFGVVHKCWCAYKSPIWRLLLRVRLVLCNDICLPFLCKL